MPRAFTTHERATITAALEQHGQRLFATQGLRKTTVDELAAAAGISKGAFYRFYASKEELFFTLLERFEAQVQIALLALIADPRLPPHERMRDLITHALDLMHAEPLFTRMGRAELAQLLRVLPPERVAAHVQGDETFAERFSAAWAAQGVSLSLPPKIVAGLLRALFFVSLHEDELSAAIYPVVIAELTDLVAGRLVGTRAE
ncbi:MAG: TetR/AcrR family transcriptional regulator [Oscillochloridaceae bacterium umkhey_bin13]